MIERYIYIYMYIYTYTEKERGRDSGWGSRFGVSLCRYLRKVPQPCNMPQVPQEDKQPYPSASARSAVRIAKSSSCESELY